MGWQHSSTTRQFVFGSNVIHTKVLPGHQHSDHSTIYTGKPLPTRGWMGRHQYTPGQSRAQQCCCSPGAVWEGTRSTKPQPRAQICQNLGNTHSIPAAPHCKSSCSTLTLAASNKEMTLLLCRQINKDKRRHLPHKIEGEERGHPNQGPPERAEVFDSAASVTSTCTSSFSGKGDGGMWDVSCACPSWVWQRPKNLKTRGKAT